MSFAEHRVSVIIVNYNTRNLLRDALQSVVNSTVSKEIIVVDNASNDGSVEMVEQEFPGVKLIRNQTNQRFAKPNNDAMSVAEGHYYFLMNSDAKLPPNSLEKLVQFMDQHPDIGMCAPQLLYPDGSVQPSCRGFITPWTHFCDMLALDRLFPHSKFFAKSEMTFFDHQSICEVDHAMAAALLIRREIIEQVGGFDERLTIYLNDVDFSMRVKKCGWKFMFFPDAKVVHHLGKTTTRMNINFELFDELYDNSFYYFRKHFGRWSVVFYKLLMLIGFTPRSIYWTIRSVFDPNERTIHMRKFCFKSLVVAFQLMK